MQMIAGINVCEAELTVMSRLAGKLVLKWTEKMGTAAVGLTNAWQIYPWRSWNFNAAPYHLRCDCVMLPIHSCAVFTIFTLNWKTIPHTRSVAVELWYLLFTDFHPSLSHPKTTTTSNGSCLYYARPFHVPPACYPQTLPRAMQPTPTRLQLDASREIRESHRSRQATSPTESR